ncbi:Ubiquinone/menaquinone biosynthesis C-methylase UbiE [Marinobacter daqiaonensis]|uniref:Ubiquinone/menaquinone biosynthesis C-methylase UbiE n=1 Tax=Marinobacter daqiaonensis TaxID=650891 RepID=A0A1I6HI30_9GAMM|nr:class I SAM-dependent methyltransferase [Marinobacter daqiaonensis]SFR54109.1 Ubiquinone/menaquinone biosynthesis C-methylase UbiE [Marinobacter daqiaonensis]
MPLTQSQPLTAFDPAIFKATTLQQWDNAAAAWNQWGAFLTRWLGPATETMLDMTHVSKNSRVLDVAAGAGEQTLATARRVGPDGYVLATDFSPKILALAAENAVRAGHSQIEFKVVDGEKLGELETEPFDAVISRVGLIYFPDQVKALKGMHSRLKPGGYVGAMVYGSAEANPFFSLPVGIIRRRAALPPPLPGQPGPFSLGNPDVLSALFRESGFRDVEIERVAAPLKMTSAHECLQFEKESFGALHQMLSALSPVEQADAWAEIEESLGQFERNGAFEGPCEMLVAAARK